MLVVFPVCTKDFDLAKSQLRWLVELGGHGAHQALILASANLDDAKARELYQLVKNAGFGTVHVIRQRDQDADRRGWPAGPNDMFKTAVEWVRGNARCPWFWCEPDAVPLIEGWVDALEAEYKQGGKPYMGTLGPEAGGAPRHLTGTAVYPPDVLAHNRASVRANQRPVLQPFDTVEPQLTLAAAHLTNLIQHVWSDTPPDGPPWTFPNKASLNRINHGAVVFHRCKDGTLINQLRLKIRPACKTCVICLGRYGDIMGALPIARDIAKAEGRPVGFMVAQQFADILDGCSYVVPNVYPGQYNQMPEATTIAQAQYERVVRVQIFGTPEADPTCGVAHNLKAWELAGYIDRWDDPRMQLEFDKRDKVRERRLLIRTVKRDPRPLLLVCLSGGNSGPFREHAALQGRLMADFGTQFQIVDLAAIKAERIYSLLALMELAAGMVTIDTATLHLACACLRLPVVALLPDTPYYAAEPRCNPRLVVRYSKWQEQYDLISQAIMEWVKEPQVIHCFEQHKGINARAKRAQSTWPALVGGFGWQQVPLKEPYPRSSMEVGDTRGVPFVDDVLRNALEQAESDNSIIIFTNDDIILLPEVHNEILSMLARVPAMCSSRRDIDNFSQVKKHPDSPKHIHCGRDLFAFRAWWLREHMPEVSPMFLASNDWDNLWVNLIRRECGTLVHEKGQWSWETSYTLTDCEMASPNILHERHESFADKPATHYDNSGNLWNWVYLIEWQKKHLPHIRFPWAEPWHAKWAAGKVSFQAAGVSKVKPGLLRRIFKKALPILYGVHFSQTPNIGDQSCSPLYYLDLGRPVEMIELASWDHRGDAIFGGGGLLFKETEKLLMAASADSAHKRILWGVGTNYRAEKEAIYPEWLTGFDLVGLRDKQCEPLVPCPSCLHAEFDMPRPSATLDSVVYEHPGEIPLVEFPKMNNHQPLEDLGKVLDFLASGRVVITNSYHGAYWATLLGRKAICWCPNSNRMLHMPWPMRFCTAENWQTMLAEALADDAKPDRAWLDWCRARNLDFCVRVRWLLRS